MIKLFLIGFFMFGAMLAIGNYNHTNAQEPELIMEGEVEEEEATEAAMLIVVEYQLPYPGILPDHPIYKLKMLRDRILQILTTDQIKKADFYLLQADKRLAASILLLEKGNDSLSETTSSKGLDYLEKTINQINDAKKAQLGTDDIVLKINSSASKHREEIENLKDETSGDISKRFEAQLKRALKLEKIAEELAPQK